MKPIHFIFFLAGVLLSAPLLRAEAPVQTKEDILKLVQGLRRRQGEIELPNGVAKLNVPKEFDYLDKDDAQTVLVKLWGNPPSVKTLGLLMPADMSPLDPDCWVVTISFLEDGFVRDTDANKINYDDLLKNMKKGAHDANPERQKQGYPSVEIVGWAAPPRYDAAAHKLYWAKEVKFGGAEKNTLNYDIRMLGRRGVLVLDAVASIDRLDAIQLQVPSILGMVNFKQGHAYADFNPKVDKVATYGIAALVAGGIAAKLGLFKGLLVFLVAAKKFLILGLVAVASFFKRLFSKNKNKKE